MKGFTLLEVLISVAILAVVLGAIYGAYSSSLGVIQIARQNGRVNQTARVILDRMTRDLESTFLTECLTENMPVTGLIGEDRLIHGQPADRINFTALTHLVMEKGDPPTDLCEIGYYLKWDSEDETLVIFRRDHAVPDNDLTKGGQSWELSRMVQGLNITYQDSEGNTFDDWNTLEGNRKDTLPSLIVITLTVRDELGKKHVFRTSVHPALSGDLGKGQ
ncbi:MAG: prepilin-type N-terminal cleavage/methylation domain-containing protein [Deltaproteobacteria bacterium]|nr:prepilin-type N-terminal cleavage/methylation domain-containing protein [Deltaproteobacteria bacterium]MBW2017702.1 prepilin-type N-terminal cleavage/methylation domain-containing protein [Deltaproteobacteria bacterium]MBW2085342.1 prepilin-type N-terminal cleavage/methylation domain-containing protein [Deltaproteobacteria bacterium]